MSASAVSGFVDGFFRGRDWKDGKEDRKDSKARQKRMDEMATERHGMSKAQHEQSMGIRRGQEGRAQGAYDARMTELDRVNAKREEEQAFMKSIAGEMGASPDSPAMQAPRADYPIGVEEGQAQQQQAQIQQPRLGYSAARPDEQPQPQMQQDPNAGVLAGRGSDDQLSGGLSILPNRGGEGEDRLDDGRRITPEVRQVDPSASAMGQDIQGVMSGLDVKQGLSRISTGLATGGASPIGRTFGAIKDYMTGTPEENAANSQLREITAVAQKFYQSDEAEQFFAQNPQQLEMAAQDPVGFFQSMQQPAQGQPQGQQPQAVPQSPADVVSGPAAQAEQVAAKPETQAAAQEGVKVAERVALSFGLKEGEGFSEKQMERGSKAYVDRYYETIVPKMAEFYAGRGEMEKAQKYIELIESREGKKAMKSIGKATFSITTGDYDSAANHMMDAFKAYGYVDEAMDVDEEATGIIKDNAGRPIGGKVVFVDRKSGNTFEKTFATPDEFIKYAHLMTSPETVAEMLMAQKPKSEGAITQQDVVKYATEIMKNAPIGSEMTPEIAMQQAQRSLGSLGQSAGGGPPQQEPLYRMER